MMIDSHLHFWKYHPLKDAWITNDMKVIQQDFLPADFLSLLQQNTIDGCIAVQAEQSEEETDFLLQLAQENDFIKGVVGWIDLRAANVEERMEHYVQYKKLKGFRHIVQAEPQDDFLLRNDFCRGIAKLARYNFTYDILIFPKQLPHGVKLVQLFPQQAFVIDHLAKPNFVIADFLEWEKNIRTIAAYKNVYCKVSGMVTEADWKNWRPADFLFCLDVVTEAFGINRLMFGSDWPVCLLAASYPQVSNIVRDYFSKFSIAEQQQFFGTNAINFYNL
jgi:L-fuconolactonase